MSWKDPEFRRARAREIYARISKAQRERRQFLQRERLKTLTEDQKERRRAANRRCQAKFNYNSRYLAECRKGIMEKLGGAHCRKCGFADVRALQIDHINGGGRKHRLNLGRGFGYQYYQDILDDPAIADKYQILCANCNWIKRHECNELPGAPRKYPLEIAA